MNDLAAGLAGQGLPVADGRELVEAGIVAGLVLLSLLLGWFAGRWAGPQLTDVWRQRVGDHAVGLAARMCDIVRHLVAVVALALVAQVRDWGRWAISSWGWRWARRSAAWRCSCCAGSTSRAGWHGRCRRSCSSRCWPDRSAGWSRSPPRSTRSAFRSGGVACRCWRWSARC
ncbi:hypothetical protein ACVOMT_08700 [Sphingomonas panni]